MKMKGVCCHGKFGWITLVVAAILIVFWQSGLWDLRYHAVSLDTGQLYFGKLAWTCGDFITLNDAYYLKVGQNATKNDKGETVNQPELQLSKVGNTELYNPGDSLEIAKDHILAIQIVGKDSAVMDGMKKQKGKEIGEGSQETGRPNDKIPNPK